VGTIRATSPLRKGSQSTIRFDRNGHALYIFDFAHDLVRKPLTLFGIMR
jgi:hypothetical protein